MFEQAIEKLYKRAIPKERKKLGILVEIFPYINIKYNIVCRNPLEEDERKVDYMDFKELAEELGYGKPSMLKKKLFDLRVDYKCVVGAFTTIDFTKILISPNAFYEGNDEKEMDYLRVLFGL